MEVGDDLSALLAEQQRELREAKLLESDLDYAFKLQMEEAAKASILLNPSSSSTSQSDIQLETDDVSDIGVAELVYEEIERFKRERSDVEFVQSEMKRVQDDLNRRIYDQAFARELERVPDPEWEKSGEDFQKPYGESSSMSTETFNLYVKGLVNEVKVENGVKIEDFAGIGVAIGVSICDSSDLSVFEFGKLLNDVEASREVAEISALIEGLDAAVSLGIKRIAVFSDDNLLYQYITGKWIPRQNQIKDMVDQVTQLQTKFTECTPSFLTAMNLNLALKLAQQALTSQSGQPKKPTENCGICLEDTNSDKMFSIKICMHRYCFSCMKKHVEAKLHQGVNLPECPHEGCDTNITPDSCQRFLTPELFHVMIQRIKESSIPAEEKVYCPYPKCSALMSKAEIHGQVAGPQICVRCQGMFCMYCNVPWHKNMRCDDYKMTGGGDTKVKNLAARNKWRQCVKCSNMVELAEGCYHIYCRCGHEFCYTCGAEWKNKAATCKCPVWDENNRNVRQRT
jgi:ribonuclease HI